MKKYLLASSLLFVLIPILLEEFPVAQDGSDLYLQGDPESIRKAWVDPDQPHIFVVAHRANTASDGDQANAPENSIRAIEEAIHHGVDVVEVDLKRTSDGHFVLMHDQDLDRTTTGSGVVSENTLNQIRELNLVHNGTVTDQHVPTLYETLDLIKGRIMINLDHVDPILEDVLTIIEEYDMFDYIVLKSRDTPTEILNRLDGFPVDEVLYMPVISASNHSDEELIDLIKDYRDTIGITAAELIFNPESATRMEEKLFRSIHSMGVRVWINTLWDGSLSGGLADEDIPKKTEVVWGTLLDRGVTIIQTDQAVYMRSYITSPHFKDHRETTENYKIN